MSTNNNDFNTFYGNIEEIAEIYNLDINTLLPELVDTGDINLAIRNASGKEALLKAITDYIKSSSVDDIYPTIKTILQKSLDLDHYAMDFHCALENRDDNELIPFTKYNLIAIIKQNNQTMPLIKGEDKQFINDVINKIVNSEELIIEMTKEDALRFYNILNHNKLPFELMSIINNYYLLCDNKDLKPEHKSKNKSIVEN